ncbi:MAG: glycosyltransferase [Acidobacteriia bacterium]|nr:glycosyltransferase [Terriglobia bacterium]
MGHIPRVAFFTDAFYEPNGVGTVSREFQYFARRHELPFFSVHAGRATELKSEGSVTTLELWRSPLAFPLDRELRCDPFLTRYKDLALSELGSFKADLVHITGPGDVGILGAWVAHDLRVPLVASWHTNLQEYAQKRLYRSLHWAPENLRRSISSAAESGSMRALMLFYGMARLLMAPNQATVELLERSTAKPAVLMGHGVDVERFHPRQRARRDGPFTLGYVGRITPEKNVRVLAEIEQTLLKLGMRDFRLVLVGRGSEESWLKANLRHAEFLGTLRGSELARAFADMDVFLFPSTTDTFGLVILEAMASGVPVIVSPGGGPQHQVSQGQTGFVAATPQEFAERVLALKSDPCLHARMREAARHHACSASWEKVFSHVYAMYERVLPGNQLE